MILKEIFSKRTLVEAGVLFICGVAIWLLVCSVKGKDAKIQTLNQNVETLMGDTASFRAENGQLVKDNGTLRLVKEDFQKYQAHTNEVLKAMDLKLNKVVSVTTAGVTTTTPITVQLTDTTIGGNPIRCFNYATPYVQASGCVDSTGLLAQTITTTDTVYVAPYVVWKKFIFRCPLWGVKETRVRATNANPDAHITFVTQTELLKGH